MRTHLDEASLALDEAGLLAGHDDPAPRRAGAASVGDAPPRRGDGDDALLRRAARADPGERRRARHPRHARRRSSARTTSSDSPKGRACKSRTSLDRGRTPPRLRRFHRSADRRPRHAAPHARAEARAGAHRRAAASPTTDIDEADRGPGRRAWMAPGSTASSPTTTTSPRSSPAPPCGPAFACPTSSRSIGHDDTPLAPLFVPALSSVRIDTAGLGRYLAELALSAATGSPAPAAGPETDAVLVVRETT